MGGARGGEGVTEGGGWPVRAEEKGSWESQNGRQQPPFNLQRLEWMGGGGGGGGGLPRPM